MKILLLAIAFAAFSLPAAAQCEAGKQKRAFSDASPEVKMTVAKTHLREKRKTAKNDRQLNLVDRMIKATTVDLYNGKAKLDAALAKEQREIFPDLFGPFHPKAVKILLPDC